MTTFEITRFNSGDDAEYPQSGGMVLHHFTEVTVRFLDGFDWARDEKALVRRLKQASELNQEEE